MPLKFRFCPTFKNVLNNLLESYSKSKEDIVNLILALADNLLGDRYPRFNEFIVKKYRIGLKKYSIGKRYGLRFIYLILKEKDKIIPLYIYKKGDFKKENDIKEVVKTTLASILEELDTSQCSEAINY